MSILKEISFKSLVKFAITEPLLFFYDFLVYPPSRKVFLKILGAKIGKETIIHKTSFFNVYRKGFPALNIGNKCFIGNECMLDLADNIIFGNNVTLAERVTILTHMNVGFKDHPLQKYFPKFSKPVMIKEGSFIGARTTILAGINIGRNCLIGANSLVNIDIPDNSVAAGNPARIIRKIT